MLPHGERKAPAARVKAGERRLTSPTRMMFIARVTFGSKERAGRVHRLALESIMNVWLALCAAAAFGAPGDEKSMVKNGGFEQVAQNGSPANWRRVNGFLPCELTGDAPRAGRRAGRIRGDGKQHAWRQEIGNPGDRTLLAAGWFRARRASLDAGDKGFCRFYFHILYKGRPYRDTTHQYVDLPVGSYDWRRIALRLTPNGQWPVEKVWVTVAARLASGTLDFDDVTIQPAPFCGGTFASEWEQVDRAIVLSDMSLARPAAALSRRPRRGRWRVISYDMGDKKGRMLWASEETGAPEAALPLHAKGWHAVFVGVGGPAHIARSVLLRLSSDSAFRRVATARYAMEEVFFKAADLTGQSLHIAQQDGCLPQAAGLAYVKLIPLTAQEVARLKAERADASSRRLVASIDGFSFIYGRRPVTRRSLLRETEVYRNTDFGLLVLQVGGADFVNYPSKVGQMLGAHLDDFPRAGDRRYAEAIQELAKRGINPTKTLIEGAHAAGLRVHVSIRPGAWIHSPPFDAFFASRFYLEHPEWRCADRNGEVVPRMSLAVPQVRRHLIDVLREAVRFGADGANVIFVRGVPYVLFEEPFRRLFQKRYGLDPRKVKDDDPRLLALRAEIITQFMAEIRAMLDEEGRARGARLELSAYVMGNEQDNLRYGLDVAAWAKKGLTDLVIPFARVGGARRKSYDLDFFRRVCAPAKMRFAPTFVTWRLPAIDQVIRDAQRFYEQGADGLSFWDANSATGNVSRWTLITRLGHKAELPALAAMGEAKAPPLRLHRVGGFLVDGPYSPNWGF